MVVASRVGAKARALLDPASSVWSSIAPTALALEGTPLGTQPTPYTRASWKGRTVGAVPRVDVRVCHDGQTMFLRLEWPDATENRSIEDSNVFPDGASVLFPIGRDAPINTMGNEREGVNAWQWRADSEQGRSIVAHGIGTTEPTDEDVAVAAKWNDGHWHVVISRKLLGDTSGASSVRLEPGDATRLGVAVWEGSNSERAGFKAFTEDWTDVRLADA